MSENATPRRRDLDLMSLSRARLEELVTAHRAEYRDTYLQFVSPDRGEAEQALRDFESEVLYGG